ncbi:hypothetical protein GCM10007424_18370 [Flavobacterium suaedae]|uniref:Uncharacterized protein n=1 Tax=Flavobacterium suaedae TaxID=1767027 RepID=A0ABQ1JYJ2_9FLAO|nr:hypothetical protein [Flavobacterium suaedae]GGB78550.1 hypothetical protein GCM10007424_18370 [Flavobacterium suaedae]
MKKIFSLLLCIVLQSFYAQNPEELLVNAYKENSTEKLDLFFKKWGNDTKPISETELNKFNDTLRNAYKVFTGFYDPYNLDEICPPSAYLADIEDNAYRKSKYYIVQNFAKIYFTKQIYYTDREVDSITAHEVNKNYINDTITRDEKLSSLKKGGKLAEYVREDFGPYGYFYVKHSQVNFFDSITNFRPKIKGNISPVYLNKKYYDILINFMGVNMDDERLIYYNDDNEFWERFTFLGNSVIMSCDGILKSDFRLLTYPRVYAIVFDANMKYARLFFKVRGRAGEAIMRNNNENWELISTRLTWGA